MPGGKQAKVPKPTANELAIQKLQLNSLIAQEKDLKAMRPFMLKSLGFREEKYTNNKGVTSNRLVKMTDEEYESSLSGTELMQYRNTILAQERESKALRGELPLTEEGQKQKAEEFDQFKEAMARRGTPISGNTNETATAMDTSGIQALGAFNRSWKLREEAERRGELDAGAQMVLARLGTTANIQGQDFNRMAGTASGMYSPMMTDASNAMQPYIRRAEIGAQVSMKNAELAQQRTQMYIKTGIAVAGMAAGGIGGAMMAKSLGMSGMMGGMLGASGQAGSLMKAAGGS